MFERTLTGDEFLKDLKPVKAPRKTDFHSDVRARATASFDSGYCKVKKSLYYLYSIVLDFIHSSKVSK